ncbi:MAG: 23S rRNA (guanosine(2251)-2'-O)-methyltransferase RlmB [Bacillota bacterium]|nr:23S rRNA (guanosine(2251)-2'-O)-methyltransferase RlmB [Bacillota bacterium]
MSDTIEGRNPVIEAIKAGRNIDKIYVKKGDATLCRIVAMAKDKKIPISVVLPDKLNELSEGGNHQGIIARAAAKEYSTVEDILEFAKSKGEEPFIIICDRITDPHNLGAIIRSANVSGAHGVIISKHESCGLSSVVEKASAGALEHTKVAKVTNITKTIELLKNSGVWVAGAAGAGENMYKCNLSGAIALVIGNEGEGIARLILDSCDMIVSIPMFGQIESLNASCAASVLMYEIIRQRGAGKN